MPKRYDNNCVLAFGDTHFPYEHKKMWSFLQSLKEHWDIDRVVHTGDLFDIYSISSYPKDPDHPDSWDDEIKRAREKAARLAEMFPKMEIMESNHDDRVYKKGRLAGVPREFLVPYREVVGAPDGWKWHRDLSIRSEANKKCMYFAHTKTGGALACAKDKGMTAVLGHHHSKFGAVAFRPDKRRTIYGVDAGCLISDRGAPYAYNKGDRGRPIQGAVILLEGTPHLEEML